MAEPEILPRFPNSSCPVLTHRYAIFVPAWQEANVISAMIAHCRDKLPHNNVRFYIGCYANDPQTRLAALEAARGDERFAIVVLDRDGPTSKADCLNHLWRALLLDEKRSGRRVHAIILHDAEDLVHPDSLSVYDRYIGGLDMVQLPVLPLPSATSPWISGHYCDEFVESHGKTMVVRSILPVSLPSAGVGCAISRPMMERLAATTVKAGSNAPFSTDSLTEDYELGFNIRSLGGKASLIRHRNERGELVATRSFFPETLRDAARQKCRWVTGIALTGWDRLGWRGGFCENWMLVRDRVSPLFALVLLAAYSGMALALPVIWADRLGYCPARSVDPLLLMLFWINVGLLCWRVTWRSAFTGHHYGLRQGMLAIPRMITSNIIAIMAATLAMRAYCRWLLGGKLVWYKTAHKFPDQEELRPL